MQEYLILHRSRLAAVADAALLSEHVYAPDQPVPTGWRILERSTAIIPAESGFYAILYMRETAKIGEARYMLAFRGIDGGQDLSSLFSVFARRVPPQYGLAQEFVAHLGRKHKIMPDQMAMTGHSLGGYLARTVGQVNDARSVVTFNSPGPTSEMKEKLAAAMPHKLSKDALIHIRSANDIISKWGYDDGTVIELATVKDHHAIAGLRSIIIDLQHDKKPLPQPLDGASPLISRLFNRLSHECCTSPPVQKMIRTLFGPDTRPA